MPSRRVIEKGRARLGREIGTVRKSHADRVKFALAFPNTYHVGMSNLGFQIIYRLLNDRNDCVCERTFLPDAEDIGEASPLVTLESETPVRDFDVVAFSLSYELDYPNVLRILSLSGIPELAEERSDGPLVIAGGPAATFNPETMAPFVDAFAIGEAEAILPGIVETLRGTNRADLLDALAKVPGVYVPRLGNRVQRQYVPSLEDHAAASAILTPETEFGNMVLAEVSRGCGRRCRFCAAGHIFLPARSRSARSVIAEIERWGGNRVGLVGASVFDHPSSVLICDALVERGRLFSISSTRADTLNADIAQTLHRGGHETLTIAPEAGTERLRMAIGKRLTDEAVLRSAAVAWDGGFRRLKLYFMVGLPTETDEDISAIPGLVEAIAGKFLWQKISVSVSCFVPKPWTPFQWAGMDAEKVLAAKLDKVKRAVRGIRRTEVSAESAREAVVQGVLARGDRTLRDAILAASGAAPNWRAAFRETGVDPSFYAQRERGEDEVFPWDVIDMGVSKEHLRREYERALARAST
ncbi:MAG: radical SAM protein [Armatimonadota bacterium]